jgi:AcrR family transcriptional regulator
MRLPGFANAVKKSPMTTSPLVKRNRLGAATRTKIIEAAISVLAEKGFSGFTLQAVADRAGVFYGNVTHHYATRDRLIEAMLDAILARYQSRFDELVAAIEAHEGNPIQALVTWLLDDAMSPETAPVMLELWAMATHSPEIAKGVAHLYDSAVAACMAALGVSQETAEGRRLRDSLYVLGTVLEGTSSIFYNRSRDDEILVGSQREAIAMLVPYLEQRLADAKPKS